MQVALFIHEVVPVMRNQKQGNVINVTSSISHPTR